MTTFSNHAYIQTISGKIIDLTAMTAEDVEPLDIAQSTAMIARWNGHIRRWWSVGDHCIYVLNLVEKFINAHQGDDITFALGGFSEDANRLAALLHDATEAYVGDVASPIKSLLPDYRELEHRVQSAIQDHFALPMASQTFIVKAADAAALRVEAREICIRPDIITMNDCNVVSDTLADVVNEMVGYGLPMEYSSPTETKQIYLGRLNALWQSPERRARLAQAC